MKIHSSPITKSTPLASEAQDQLSHDCHDPLRGGGIPLPGNKIDAPGKQISIATHNLHLGCRIRQNDENYAKMPDHLNCRMCPNGENCAKLHNRLDCRIHKSGENGARIRDHLDYRIGPNGENYARLRDLDENNAINERCFDCYCYQQMLLTKDSNAEGVDRDALFQKWFSGALVTSEGAWPCPTGCHPVCRRSSSAPPRIREYRKNLSVRLGSLRWSLDLVMVVKSRTPSSRTSSSRASVATDDTFSGKSSSRTWKVSGPSDVIKRSRRTASCSNLLLQIEDES